MPSASERLRDALTRRQIFLQQYGTTLAEDAQRILNRTEPRIRELLETHLVRSSGTPQARLRALRVAVAEVRGAAWQEIATSWSRQMRELASVEAGFLNNAVQQYLPGTVTTSMPTASQLNRIVIAEQLQGRTLRQWTARMASQDISRIVTAARIGVASGDSFGQLSARIFGTRAMRNLNGVTRIALRDLSSVSLTAVNHVGSGARDLWLKLNKALVKEEQYSAVLDANTTILCAGLDGNVYAVGKGPHPPLHFRCRSKRIPLIGGVRPKRITYQQWLATQSPEFQDQVLGPTRGKLFRDGGITLDKFTNNRLRKLRLDELRTRHPDAFAAADL